MFSPINEPAVPKAVMDRNVLFNGFCLIIVYWFLDAALDAAVFKDDSFAGAVFHPPYHQVVDRLLVLLVVLSFVRYALRASQSRASLENALQDALKKAEQERAKLVAFVEAMGDGISIQSPELTVLYQNQEHQLITGSHVGEPCYQAYRQQSAPCPGCHLLEAFQEGGVHRLEVRREGKQGPRWYEILGSAARDEAGRVTAGVEVMRDITDRKLAEQAVSKQAALLQHLIDTIPNPVYYQDAGNRVIWCNFAFAAWLGKPRELLVGRTIAEVAPAQVSRTFLEKEPAVQETTLLRGDGELRDIIFYKSPFSEPEGEPGGLVGVIIDITPRKQAEQEIVGLNAALTQQAVELQQVNRELEAFNHAISHDLRTSLTRIYSYAQLLQECEGQPDQDRAVYVQGVNEGCLQVEGLLNSLLSLSRATEMSLKTDQVDLSKIASQTARGLQMADPGRSASFQIQPGLRAVGDLQLMQVALENLIGNAWKYTAKTPQAVIEVGALTSGVETVFFVRDNGAGFDSSQSEHLFKPFRRLHSSTDFPGNGLGLATVRRIIRRHNGRVWGESSPGRGATFFFTVGA